MKKRLPHILTAAAYLDGNADAETEISLNARDVLAMQRTALQILAQNDILPIRFELLAPSIENLFLEAVQ